METQKNSLRENSQLLSRLPAVRGKLRANADLSKVNWFQVGGTAEVMFKPEDLDDLSYFIVSKPKDVSLTMLGVGSNLLVRDGGIDGVVIRLGKGFSECQVEEEQIVVGAGCLNSNVAKLAQAYGLGGLEFLSGIPGGIGGALAMNAGAYGCETKDIIVQVEAIDPQGRIHILTPSKLNYSYRRCGLGEGWIFTRATLRVTHEDPFTISMRMDEIANQRNSTQPIRTKTGGSTFKNPEGHKAWQLIDAAGCRGLTIGGAQMSELHCNFMINTGEATARDLETLGEEVRKRVQDKSGIMLEWEIRRLGKALQDENQMLVE